MEFSNVNFDNLNEVNDLAKTICNEANNAGMFLSSQPASCIFGEIRLSAKKWVQEIDSRINRYSPSEALEAIGYYDIIHRIAYCCQANPATINKYILQAFEAYIRGDKSIDQYELFSYISSGLKRRDPAYFDRPLQWHSICLDRWHKQFRYGSSSEYLSDYDTIQRVCALLDSDLWAFETSNENNYKQLLFDTHKHFLENLKTAASTMDLKTKKSLEHFLFVSHLYLTSSEYCNYQNLLMKIIA